jgi:hypothetical protein
MRRTILAAAAAFVVGGVATGAVLSQAQTAPPPAVTDGPAGQMQGSQHHWMGWRGMHARLRNFALVYRQEDRKLDPADVRKIAEAFLLWNGNHSWKVTDVAATADGPIGFSLATPEGSIVAKFTMDPHTARVTRVS